MRLISILIISIFLISCKKEKDVPNPPGTTQSALKNGLLVLNEGLFQQNNSSLSWVDMSTGSVENQFFESKAGRLLGDTGNDMKRYGGKIYIVVNVSSTVEVMDANTGAAIKQISMMSNGVAKQPRNIVFKGSKAYVSCFDGYVDVLDTSSLSIEKRIKVGLNPEGLEISNNKLYVANSGGLNGPKMDSTVSVVDIASLQEIKKIVVGQNPGGVVRDEQGDIYVIARGNYGSIPSRMVRINTTNDVVENTFSFDASGFSIMGSNILISYIDKNTSKKKVALFDPISESISNSNFMDLSQVTTLYNIIYSPSLKKIYCLDAMNYTNTGYVRVYSSSGSYENSYHVGLNPNSILIYE